MGILLLIGICGAAMCWLVRQAKLEQQKRQQAELQSKVDSLLAEAKNYIERLNRSRSFPTIDMLNVNAQRDEFGLFHESTTLFELKSHRVGGAVGTRVKVGQIPIYLGGFQSTSIEDWSPAADGDLYLTNKRIVFVGNSRSAAIALKDMTALDVELGAVRIHTGKRQKPYIFRVANSILWSLLAKLAASGNLTIPQLPSGLQLDFSAAQDGSNAEIRIMPGQL